MALCSACSGSGYYDADGSPPCGSCNGTGERELDNDELKERLNGLADAVSNALARIPKDSRVYADLKAALDLYAD